MRTLKHRGAEQSAYPPRAICVTFGIGTQAMLPASMILFSPDDEDEDDGDLSPG